MVGQVEKGRRTILVGVTGNLELKFAGKKIDFGFTMLAEKGGRDKLKIRASTKDKLSIPFIVPLAVDRLNLTATHAGGKWFPRFNARTKLNRKEIGITAAWVQGKPYVNINSALTVADLIPGAVKIPGLSDIKFKTVQIHSKRVFFRDKIKGMYMLMEGFHRPGVAKPYFTVSFDKAINLGTFIPALKGSPLDDVND